MKTHVLTNALCISAAIIATGCFHTARAQGPNAPTSLAVQPIVNVDWTGATGVSYNIYRSGTSGYAIIGTGTVQQVVVTNPVAGGSGSGTFPYYRYTDTSEPNAPCYFSYTISGSNSSGNSAQSTPCAIDNPLVYYPNASNRPHILSASSTSGTIMGYTDANGVAQTVTLKPLPTVTGDFGPGNAFKYNAANGQVSIYGNNSVLSGYDFNNAVIYGVYANNVTISCNWFYNTPLSGETGYSITTASGGYSGLTVSDNLCNGTTVGSGTAYKGLVTINGTTSNVSIERNCSYDFGQTYVIDHAAGSGVAPYTNDISDNYNYADNNAVNSVPWHSESIIVEGTGGVLISHNHMAGPLGGESTIYIVNQDDNSGNVTVDDNLLDGYPQETIEAGDLFTTYTDIGNVRITNNKFDSTYGQNDSPFGAAPKYYVNAPSPGTTGTNILFLNGNVYYPSMTLISGTAWNQ